MTMIIRAKRNTPFVQIDKRGLQDKGLSWKAKGMLAYLLTLPDDWQIYIKELQSHSTDGRDSTASALKELIKNGYVVKTRKHRENGTFEGYDYQVIECPRTENGLTVNGKPENGLTVNGKPENGLTVNGKPENGLTVNGKPVTTNNISNCIKNNTDKVVVEKQSFEQQILKDEMFLETVRRMHKLNAFAVGKMLETFMLQKKGLQEDKWPDYSQFRKNFLYWIPKVKNSSNGRGKTKAEGRSKVVKPGVAERAREQAAQYGITMY